MRAQPRLFVQRRLNVGARLGRTRPEMAADLVRLEYERTRLERTLAALDARRKTVMDQLGAVTERAHWIQARLAEETPTEDAQLTLRAPVRSQGSNVPKRRGQR